MFRSWLMILVWQQVDWSIKERWGWEVPAASWSLVSSQLPLEAAAHLSSSLQALYWWPAVDGGGGRNGGGGKADFCCDWCTNLKLCETWYYLECVYGGFMFFLPPQKNHSCILQTFTVLKDINLPSKLSVWRWMLLALKHSVAFCLLA